METYWMSFRLKENSTYDERINNLTKVIYDIAEGGTLWTETTSFFLFSSSLDVESITLHVKTAINEKTDLVIIGATESKTGRVIGNFQDKDIFTLVPFMKKC